MNHKEHNVFTIQHCVLCAYFMLFVLQKIIKVLLVTTDSGLKTIRLRATTSSLPLPVPL